MQEGIGFQIEKINVHGQVTVQNGKTKETRAQGKIERLRKKNRSVHDLKSRISGGKWG